MNFLKLERRSLRSLTYQSVFTLFATWLIWPIYNDGYLAVLVSLAAVLGIGGAILMRIRESGWLSTFLYGVAVSVLVGPIVSAPYILGSGANLLTNWMESLSSIVLGWKQLITIDPPVGTYHGLMVPAFLVFFASNLIAASIATANPRRHWIAIIPFFAMVIFAFAFGQQDVPQQTSILGVTLDVNSAYVSALVILMVSVKFLTPPLGKRARFGLAGGFKQIARQGFQLGGSWVLVVAALMVVVFFVGSSMGTNRDVLRSAKPPVFTGEELSPLSLYRQNFNDVQKLNSEVLSYDSTDPALTRIRLAVMTHFNGQVFTVQDSLGEELPFRLLPASLVESGNTDKVAKTTFKLTDRELVWLPIVANLSKVDFEGAESKTFGDHFYFNRETTSGALLGDGVPEGAIDYVVESVADDSVDPASISSSPNSTCTDTGMESSVVPQSLCDWITLQNKDLSTAAGLEQLIKTLRARGYLSHSLDEPKSPENWTKTLVGYQSFIPAKAGHSKGRIEQMFKDLNALQTASPKAKNSQLVATIGDDEQFATAAALLAQAAGYDSRVVLGFRTPNAPANASVPACENNVCRGKNLTAWVEVSSAGSPWYAIDVSPQFKDKPKSPPIQDGLIQHQANPGKDDATVLPPARVEPTESPKCELDPNAPECKVQFDVWGLIVQIVTTVLVSALAVTVVVGPFAVIILGKRRRRRTRQDPNVPLAKRITNAWDEYVDNLIDLGENGLRRLPGNETRPELIRKAVTDNATYAEFVVRNADFAAFAPEEPNPQDEQDAWKFVDSEFAKATEGMSRYRRLRVLLSLRSFLYRASEAEPNTVNKRRIGPDGSTFSAFLVVAKHGTIEGLEWLKPRVSAFIDKRMPFLTKFVAKVPRLPKRKDSADE